jgi:hypothetical protein
MSAGQAYGAGIYMAPNSSTSLGIFYISFFFLNNFYLCQQVNKVRIFSIRSICIIK